VIKDRLKEGLLNMIIKVMSPTERAIGICRFSAGVLLLKLT
jgi:hypothetical protein